MRRAIFVVLYFFLVDGLQHEKMMITRRCLMEGCAWTNLIVSFPVIAEMNDVKCTMQTNPLFSKRTCQRYGLQQEGSQLLGCKPSENCVSTSAISSPDKFGAPWSFRGDIETAFKDLINTLPSVGLQIATVDNDRKYLRANGKTTISINYPLNDVDDVEFLLDPKQQLVFYRSVSRESVFFFPPQNLYSVPISDSGSNRARLELLRTKLGWDTLAALYSSEDDDPRDYLPQKSPFDDRSNLQ